jgi:hypothetical protein
MVMNPGHPAYSDPPYEYDPSRECPHWVPYPTPCADCVAECPHGVPYPCADCVAEDREADEEAQGERRPHRARLDRLAHEIAQLRRDGLADLGAARLCGIVDSLIGIMQEKERP